MTWGAPRRTAVMLGCAVLLSAFVGESWAQDNPGAARPTVWIEPNISLGSTLSSNGGASSGNSRSELLLEIAPGVRAVMNTPRLKGFVDYSLRAQYYAEGNSGNRLSNRLNASGTLDAWDQRAFVDISGAITDQAVSAFGPQSITGLSDTNRSETSSFRVSPYIGGSLAGLADYQLRYSLQTFNTNVSSRSDFTNQVVSLNLGRQPMGRLGWLFDASMQESDYTVGRDTSADSARLGLIVAVSPQLKVTLTAGIETNDVITLRRESYNTAGVSVDWRPSQRTRLSVSTEDRYFGIGYNIAVEHRTGRTVWRYVASRDASDSPAQSGSVSQGSIYDLLDALLTEFQPDPVLRAQLVQAELLRLGLPADAQIFQNFLSSSTTLNRDQQLSVALSGVRSVVTFSITRGSRNRLNTLSTLGDDFDFNDSIHQRSWGVNYAHRVTPQTSFNAAFVAQKNSGNSGLNSNRQSVSVGLSTRLATRTNGSVQLQYGRFNNTAGSYNDTAISGLINHRF